MIRPGLSAARLLILAACLLVAAAPPAAPAKRPSAPAGLSAGEAMRLGEAMYRKGILPSGSPMQAVVEGDIPVDGTMFTCQSCHMLSGLGSVEGTIISPPTNGEKLYRPRKSGQEFSALQRKHLPDYFQIANSRQAYTDKTLAKVLRTGIDPSGRKLDPIMPRYLLKGRDLDILVHYLKNLSTAPSPGVSDTVLKFASVIDSRTAKEDRDAMFLPLEAFMRDRSVRADYYSARAKYEPFAEEMDRSYRKLEVAPWTLTGEPDTWRAQLEAQYAQEPVFALVGGIVEGDWQPIHAFCEEHGIPCIFPVTDRPVVSGNDWYTLYLSKGPYQEGEAAAKFLQGLPPAGREDVLQVFRKTEPGISLARGFRETRQQLGLAAPAEIMLGPDEKIDDAFWKNLANAHPGGTLALWLGMKEIAGIAPHAGLRTLLLSASALAEPIGQLPGELRQQSYIAYPYRPPQEQTRILQAVKSWMRVRKIPETNLKISADMYVLGTLLTDALMHMQQNYYRDYFLDVIDMLQDQSYTVANYIRLSFGPGQRYASKGCYIVQVSPGEQPTIVKKSDWVIH